MGSGMLKVEGIPVSVVLKDVSDVWRVLTDIETTEKAGIVVRVPDGLMHKLAVSGGKGKFIGGGSGGEDAPRDKNR